MCGHAVREQSTLFKHEREVENPMKPQTEKIDFKSHTESTPEQKEELTESKLLLINSIAEAEHCEGPGPFGEDDGLGGDCTRAD